MKKWTILAGSILALWLMVLASYLLIKGNSVETYVQSLEKDNVRLRVIAENYELKYKIQVIEEKLKARTRSKNTPAKIAPFPNGANVEVKRK